MRLTSNSPAGMGPPAAAVAAACTKPRLPQAKAELPAATCNLAVAAWMEWKVPPVTLAPPAVSRGQPLGCRGCALL